MSDFYEGIDKQDRGAWVIHHGQKTTATTNGASEFPALDTAGKAASLLSQLAATDQNVVEKAKLDAFAKAAGLNPHTELPALLEILAGQRLIERSASGGVEALGLSSSVTARHAADIFEVLNPTAGEKATIALAEVTSKAPNQESVLQEFISDEFGIKSDATAELLFKSAFVGFVDTEGEGTDKLYFNGNLFRRDNLNKTMRVLDSLSDAERSKVVEMNDALNSKGCISIEDAELRLGTTLFAKLKAAGMYDINYVANPSGEFGFVTRPSAFHKFNNPFTDDAFDLAKALVSALMYGMTQSPVGRGRIGMIRLLLGKLITGVRVGPATAIGEDYRVLETKGVLQITRGESVGFYMKLLKIDVGEMALKVLTVGDTSAANVLDRPLPGRMEGYTGPEQSRANFRRKQVPMSKRDTYNILVALRTGGL